MERPSPDFPFSRFEPSTWWNGSKINGSSAAGIPTPAHVATPASLYAWVIVTEVAVTAALAGVAVVALRFWGPGRLKGMASRTDTEHLLGVSRLRRVRHVIRPDLYSTRRKEVLR